MSLKITAAVENSCALVILNECKVSINDAIKRIEKIGFDSLAFTYIHIAASKLKCLADNWIHKRANFDE